MDILEFFGLFGGLALFLHGMQMMSSGLEAAAGNRMKSVLERLTANRFMGILLGALIMHGLTPGQSMFGKNVTTTYTIIIGFIAANILMGLIGMLICRQVIKITKVSDAILVPVIVVLSTIGSYSINNRISDVYMMLAFGLIGYLFKKVGLPTAPIILGLLLESTGEQGFKNAILMAKDTPVLLYYLQRPASLVLILLIVATVIVPTIQSAVKAVRNRRA